MLLVPVAASRFILSFIKVGLWDLSCVVSSAGGLIRALCLRFALAHS